MKNRGGGGQEDGDLEFCRRLGDDLNKVRSFIGSDQTELWGKGLVGRVGGRGRYWVQLSSFFFFSFHFFSLCPEPDLVPTG